MSQRETDFISFRVSTLRGDQRIPFDAFVKVGGKYILFCREGDSFEGDRLTRLRAKNLKRMYIRRDQTGGFDQYIKENTRRAFEQNKDVAFDQRLQIIQGAIQASTEDLIEELDNQSFFSALIDSVKRFQKFLDENNQCLAGLLNMKNSDFSIEQHGVTVAALSLELTKQLGQAESRPMQLPHLGVGALIHDLEHHYTPITLSKPIAQLSQNEMRVYHRHNVNGANRIKEIYFYDQVTRDIIQFHDEKIDGTGINKKKEKDLDPFVFIVSTADTFDQTLTRENLSAKDALKKIMIEKMGVLPLECLKALQEVLKKNQLA